MNTWLIIKYFNTALFVSVTPYASMAECNAEMDLIKLSKEFPTEARCLELSMPPAIVEPPNYPQAIFDAWLETQEKDSETK